MNSPRRMVSSMQDGLQFAEQVIFRVCKNFAVNISNGLYDFQIWILTVSSVFMCYGFPPRTFDWTLLRALARLPQV